MCTLLHVGILFIENIVGHGYSPSWAHLRVSEEVRVADSPMFGLSPTCRGRLNYFDEVEID